MAAHKRRREEGSLQIKLAADDAGPIFADRTILAACSSCVRGLPADSDEWDVSKFTVEGQAVEQHTVVAWLNAIYLQNLDVPFEQQEVTPASNMHNMALLLAFADAVGCSRFFLSSLVGDLDELVAEVHMEQLPSAAVQDQQQQDQQQRILRLQTADYHSWRALKSCKLKIATGVPSGADEKVVDIGTAERKTAFVQQVALQTEALLYYAHSLRLPSLQHKLHHFIHNNTNLMHSLLYGSMGVVFSDRVIGAAADKLFCRQAVINNILTQQGALLQHHHMDVLLQPVGSTVEGVKFDAVLGRDAFGCRKGNVVTVSLHLHGSADLHEPFIKINGHTHLVQLLIGTAVCNEASMQAVMGPP